MIVQCDKCGAKFQLADDKITDKGAKVRCSKCKAVFTVKKSKEPEAAESRKPSAPKPAMPPAPPKAPAGSALGSGKEADPFADFNFDDQVDFEEGGEEITVEASPKAPAAPAEDLGPPPAPAVGPSFLNDPPAAAAEPKEDEGEGFDFSEDEDFSFADDASGGSAPAAPDHDDFGAVSFDDAPSAPAPAAPPHPAPFSAAPSPAAAPKAAGKAGGDDFGDFKFDDDSFGEAPAGGSAGPPASDGDWGNVSFEAGGGGGAATDDADDVIDEAGFGDFQFDGAGDAGSKSADDDMSMDLSQDFVRSPTSKAPVRDDLEASIGETEAPPERSAPAPTSEAPPPPPRPVHKSGGGSGNMWLVVVVLILAALGGGGYMFKEDLLKLINPTTGPVDLGDWTLVGKPQIKSRIREEGGQQIAIIVAEGDVKNGSTKIKTGVLVRVTIDYSDDTGKHQLVGQSHCGVTFSEGDLTGGASRTSIERDMNTVTGQDTQCLQVPSGQTRPYTVVFFDLPASSEIKILSEPKAEIVPEPEEGEPAEPPEPAPPAPGGTAP